MPRPSELPATRGRPMPCLREVDDGVGERLDGRLAAELRRVPEPRQVEREHLVRGRQAVERKRPRLQMAADAVDEHERLAAALADVVEHRATVERGTPRRRTVAPQRSDSAS